MASSQGNALTRWTLCRVFECSNPRVSGPLSGTISRQAGSRPFRPAIARPPVNAA
jgi:hypothetical protein